MTAATPKNITPPQTANAACEAEQGEHCSAHRLAGDDQLSGRQYTLLQQAFDFFNVRLFAGELPQVLITLYRHKKASGFFCPNQFTLARPADRPSGPFEDRIVHEIALNPECFLETIPTKETLSTLGHEMAHLWQEECGKKKPRKAYHNKEWARKMEEIGLMPSATGQPGGKKTGQSMSDYIITGGPFDIACDRLIEQAGNTFLINAVPKITAATSSEKKKLKAKFECPVCKMKAWAKPTARLNCGECEKPMLSDSPDVE